MRPCGWSDGTTGRDASPVKSDMGLNCINLSILDNWSDASPVKSDMVLKSINKSIIDNWSDTSAGAN